MLCLVPPKGVREPSDVEGVEGQDIVLPCQVDGYPPPSTVWTKDSGYGYPSSAGLGVGVGGVGNGVGSGFGARLPNGSLLLSAADKRDEGRYTCTAENGVRPAIARTVNVTINGRDGVVLVVVGGLFFPLSIL